MRSLPISQKFVQPLFMGSGGKTLSAIIVDLTRKVQSIPGAFQRSPGALRGAARTAHKGRPGRGRSARYRPGAVKKIRAVRLKSRTARAFSQRQTKINTGFRTRRRTLPTRRGSPTAPFRQSARHFSWFRSRPMPRSSLDSLVKSRESSPSSRTSGTISELSSSGQASGWPSSSISI